MLRIPTHFLECSVYLYRSEQGATQGEASGGSGFLAHVASGVSEGVIHVYAVTNRHVVDEGKCHFLRINRRDGGTDIISTTPESWVRHPEADDVVALPIEMGPKHKWLSVNITEAVTQDLVAKNEIGIGDEVCLVGRLITRDGKQQNKPVVRFGHLSMMDDAIKRDDGERQRSFLIECRSVSGFSGSPVFVYVADPISVATNRLGAGMAVQQVPDMGGIWLLGIDWCHIPLWKPVYGADRNSVAPGLWMEQNTGIAGVVPAWRLRELLDQEVLVKQRTKDEKRIARDLGGIDTDAPLDSKV